MTIPPFNKIGISVLSLTLVVTVALTAKKNMTANNLAGLRALEIQAFGNVSLEADGRVLLTAVGDYTTYTIPLRASWDITNGTALGRFLEPCDAQKSCTFVAGRYGGEVTIAADANGFRDTIDLFITAPTNPAPLEEESTPVAHSFKDDIPDWASKPIVSLQKRNIIKGYDDGRYGPGDLLTRGQLVTIFFRVLKAQGLIGDFPCADPYKDVPESHYAHKPTCAFRALGWTDQLSTFDPEGPVNRGETAAMLTRVVGPTLLSKRGMSMGSVIASGRVFSDIAPDDFYFADTAVAHALGIMKGNPDGSFDTKKTLNRAEAATIFYRVGDLLTREGVRDL